MIRTIFFDVDGTLFSHTQHAVPASTAHALEQLGKKEILRVVATGRHLRELPQLPVRSDCFDAFLTLNGQLCLDAQGNILFSNPITGDSRDALLRLFREKTVPVMLIEKDRMYLNFADPRVEAAQTVVSSSVAETGSYTGNALYQAVAYLDRTQEDALRKFLPGCKITRWNDCAVDIIAASDGKADGIREYLRVSGIAPEETMAFGDGDNNLEMLRLVGLGVAMGNATQALKACADYVTTSVDDDGIPNALTALGILP